LIFREGAFPANICENRYLLQGASNILFASAGPPLIFFLVKIFV